MRFFLYHPWGIEAVVERDVERVLKEYEVGSLLSIEERNSTSTRGVTFLSSPLDAESSEIAAHMQLLSATLFRGLYRLRTIDSVLLWLFSCPLISSCEELDDVFGKNREVVKHAVRLVTELRMTRVDDPVMSVCKEFFTNARYDNKILFRVNALRRDKSVKTAFNSQDLCQHFGGLLYDAFSSSDPASGSNGWRVDLIHYNTEFLLVHDKDTVHAGLVIHPPNVPKSGSDAHPMDSIAREILRQRMSCSIAASSIDPSDGDNKKNVGQQVSRPSHFKHDIRRLKGDNAMHPAIASMLAAIGDAHLGDVVMDPLCGCGTVLMECWLRNPSIALLGGDVSLSEARRASQNLGQAVEGLAAYSLFEMPATTPAAIAYLTQRRDALEKLARHANVNTWSTESTAFSWHADAFESFMASISDADSARPHSDISQPRATVFQWDATRLPFKNNSVDVIVSDLPFGRRCGNHGINAKTYPALLKEFHRVLRHGDASTSDSTPSFPWTRRKPGCGRCVLLTIEGKTMAQSIAAVSSTSPFRLVVEPFPVDMGGLCPYVFVLDAAALSTL